MTREFMIPPDFAARNEAAFAALIRGEKPEIIPVNLMLDSVFQMEMADISAEQYLFDYEAHWQSQVVTYKRFGGAVAIMPFYYPVIEATALARVEPVIRQRAAPMIHPCIFSEADVDRLRPPRMGQDGLMGHMVQCQEYLLRRSAETGIPVAIDYGSMGPIDIAALLMGPTEFFVATKKRRKMVHKLLSITSALCIEWIQWKIGHFGGPMPVLDLGEDYAAYFRPDEFEEYVLSYTGAVMRAFPDAYNMWHSDGDFRESNLPKVRELNIDMFNAFSPNIDIGLVRQVLGPEVDLAGNIHPIHVMVFGTPQDVLREARRCIEAAGKDGHYVLAPGGGVGAGTRPENVDALVQASLQFSTLMTEG
jgi:uroporphyrinogen decarboxylase